MKRYVVCLMMIILVYGAKGQTLDLRLLKSINGPVSPADQTWRDVSKSVYVVNAGVPVSMVIVGLTTHNKDLTIKGIETAGSVLIAESFTAILKNTTKRQRPHIEYPGLITGKSSSTDYSFPSGHTSVAFATATSLSLSFPKWYVIVPSYTYATAVGYSRMYLGVHYPSDVFAGALIGAGSSFLTWKLQKLLNKKYYYH